LLNASSTRISSERLNALLEARKDDDGRPILPAVILRLLGPLPFGLALLAVGARVKR
jgi:hypothetical protein